jgi:hypothetical protein|tara:strand:+ start:10427 stop:10699 length:273 start_codon:yes stop_codon:yes gene_type:complete
MQKLNKKGSMGLNQLSGVVLVLVVSAITLGLGLTVLQSFSAATTGTAGTAVNATITAVGTLGTTWFSIIVTVVAAVIILGLIIRSLMGGR